MAASQRTERSPGVAGARHLGALATSRLFGAGMAAWLVLFGAVQVGLSTPDRELLSGASAGAALDYSALRGTIAQLTEAFIAEVLGLADATSGGREPSGPAPQPAPGAVAAPTTAPDVVAPAGQVEVVHAPDNDAFGDAYPVSSVPFAARTDPSSASRQGGEPSSCAATGPTLWYRYTADRTAALTAHSVARGSAAAVAVFVGVDLDRLEALGCDGSASGPAVVRFLAEAGTTYRFQVAAPLGANQVRFGLDALGTTTRMPSQSDETFADASCEPVEFGPYPAPMSPQPPVLSDDGRFAVFANHYSETFTHHCPEHRVPLGSDDYLDVFVYDRVTGVTEMVSVSSEEEPGNERSGIYRAAISADGRFVAFWSNASNLVPDDTNGTWDLFVRDRVAGETTRVSLSSDGAEGRPPPLDPWYDFHYRRCETFGGKDGPPVRDRCHWRRTVDMTPDGRYVVFGSDLVGLVEDADAPRDRKPVYRNDRVTGETIKVSLLSQADAAFPTISSDGTRIAYIAVHDQFQPLPGGEDDPPLPGREDYPPPLPDRWWAQVFVRDLTTGETRMLTRGHDGRLADASMGPPKISDDGRYVAFTSSATNLVPHDRNGVADVFVADLGSGELELVSVNSAEEQQIDDERTAYADHFPSISADGRYIAFESTASNLDSDSGRDQGPDTAAGNCPAGSDVFVRDRVAGTTLLVSVSSSGEPGNRCSAAPFISADGGTVVYFSAADNLVEDDINGDWGGDLFFHDFAVLP
ncbi:MAG: hypothetical protein KY469_06770 [Actinobacteria bacterium]|nr:hypothetical protein [Actinomycetota bacterium]